jgi:hypothetical protein
MKGMFGAGIYTAPNISKALGHAFSAGVGEPRYVFAAMVALGRVYEAPEANRSLCREALEAMGYDSVCGKAGVTKSWGGKLTFTEYVVYDPDRVMLINLLEFPPAITR